MKKRISILSILLLLGMTVYAQTDIPQVIPSLQHWNGAKGKLTLPETGKDYNRSGSRKPVERNCGNNGKRLKRYVRLELSGNLRKTEKSFYLSVSEKNAFIIGRRKL